MTGSDQQFFFNFFISPGSHLSMLTPTTDDPCHSCLSSAPDLGVFSNGEGSAKDAFGMGKDVFHLSSAISEDTALHPSDHC